MEREIKIRILTKEGFDKMVSLLPQPYETAELVNYYFDTPGVDYGKAHCLLRLRHAKGKYIVTFKRGHSLEEGYFQAFEEEKELSAAEAHDILTNPQKILTISQSIIPVMATEDPVALLGSAKTKRSKIKFSGYVIKMDEVLSPNGCEDYEIEVETEHPEEIKSHLLNLMNEHLIEYSMQIQTKYQRFLENMNYEKNKNY